jgi:hypothetical protein
MVVLKDDILKLCSIEATRLWILFLLYYNKCYLVKTLNLDRGVIKIHLVKKQSYNLFWKCLFLANNHITRTQRHKCWHKILDKYIHRNLHLQIKYDTYQDSYLPYICHLLNKVFGDQEELFQLKYNHNVLLFRVFLNYATYELIIWFKFESLYCINF